MLIVESSKEIGPLPRRITRDLLRRGKGLAKLSGDSLAADRLVANKRHGSDWTVVFRGRPHTIERQDMNNPALIRILRRKCWAQLPHSLSTHAVEGTGPHSPNTCVKVLLTYCTNT